MKLLLGDKVIFTDEHNWIVCDEIIVEKGKNAGQRRLVNHKYYPSLKLCLKHLLDQELRESDARDVRELSEKLDEALGLLMGAKV